MLRKTLLFAVAVLCVAALCYADEKPAAMATSNTGMQINGTVDHLDAAAKTITLRIKRDGKEQTAIYTYTDQTAFMKGSKTVQPEDIQVGSQVAVKADTDRVIATLEIKESPSKKPSE